LHVSSGRYREITLPSRLIMTHGWEDENGELKHETVVSVTFTERDGKTEMLFEQVGFESEGSRKGHEGGWNEAFDNLFAALKRAA
jgi:uncharacterized protein YndB with AHSA1/START domain